MMASDRFYVLLSEIHELFSFLGQVSLHVNPESGARRVETLHELDYRYSEILECWPSARDDTVILTTAKAVRRTLHELEAA